MSCEMLNYCSHYCCYCLLAPFWNHCLLKQSLSPTVFAVLVPTCTLSLPPVSWDVLLRAEIWERVLLITAVCLTLEDMRIWRNTFCLNAILGSCKHWGWLVQELGIGQQEARVAQRKQPNLSFSSILASSSEDIPRFLSSQHSRSCFA